MPPVSDSHASASSRHVTREGDPYLGGSLIGFRSREDLDRFLGALQSAIAFRGEAAKLTTNLSLAAERSASVARARLEAADVLLEEEGVVVARAPGRPVPLRYNAVR